VAADTQQAVAAVQVVTLQPMAFLSVLVLLLWLALAAQAE
jgi:hypothetical protein